MNSFGSQPNPFQPAKRPAQKSPASFIEALKSIGGQTVKSIQHDVVGGVGRDFVNTLAGNNPGSGNYNQSEMGQQAEWARNHEQQVQEEALRLQRHKELTQTSIYDRKEEERNQKIKLIQEQLAALAKDLVGLSLDAQKAIEEAVVNPGVYHEHFFDKLRQFIVALRKQVADSSSWLETMTSRHSKQQGYWGNVAKSGTKYMMSDERKLATSAG